jgi:hypothetical protein
VSRWFTIEYSDGETEDVSPEHMNELAAYLLGTTCPGCARLPSATPAKVTARRGKR